MIVILDQCKLSHKKTSPRHHVYGLHMLQNGGTVQFYRTVDTDLPKLCYGHMRRHHRSEYSRASNGDRDYLAVYEVVYTHNNGTRFADVFGDDQWGFPGGQIIDPNSGAAIDVENFGTTFAYERTVFGTTVPTPDGEGRVHIGFLLERLCGGARYTNGSTFHS